jgi:hypothetical protein
MKRSGLALSFAVSLAGCGNYSNEDLEFMNALPTSGDLTVDIPARSSAVTILEEAELARETHKTTRELNNLTALLVGLVDAIRSSPPTSRTARSRIWGPFGPGSNDKNPSWLRRMMVSRDDVDPAKLRFEIAVHEAGASDLAWPALIAGWFDPGRKARQGLGHLEVVTAAVRAAGLDLSDWGALDHLEIDYDTPFQATAADPIAVHMKVTNLPTAPADPSTASTAEYTYLATAEGQGQMTFDMYANVVMVTAQFEHVSITSQWLASGEGVAQRSIVSGDGAGLTQKECWDGLFKPTFGSKPWGLQSERLVGDEALCPDIPLLSAPAPS